MTWCWRVELSSADYPTLNPTRPKRNLLAPLPTSCSQANVKQPWSFCQAVTREVHLDDPSDPNTSGSPTVRDVLISKHPTGHSANADCVLPLALSEVHPVIFESIDTKVTHSATVRISGSARPSGLDVHDWRRLCTSFKGVSVDLCNALASTGRSICTSLVDPKSPNHTLANLPLIALDKSPGVRPIGIGDMA